MNHQCRLYSTIGVPYWKHENITYLPQETHFTAVLQLGDMFGGGGVPIDHYIIQVDTDTELETTGPFLTLRYRTTLLVNISAHNCAGYSNPVTLELHYNHTLNQGIVFLAIFTIFYYCYAYSVGIQYNPQNT